MIDQGPTTAGLVPALPPPPCPLQHGPLTYKGTHPDPEQPGQLREHYTCSCCSVFQSRPATLTAPNP